MKSVYSAVRTGSLNKAVCASSLKGSILYVPCVIFALFVLINRCSVHYFSHKFTCLTNMANAVLLCTAGQVSGSSVAKTGRPANGADENPHSSECQLNSVTHSMISGVLKAAFVNTR
jgi:hypothetical protein